MPNINPKLWGKSGWKFMLSIALGYSDNPTIEQKKNFRYFFENISNILPCEKCAHNYKNHLLELPLDNDVMQNRDNLVLWLTKIRNKTNVLTGDKIMSYQDMLNELTHVNKETSILSLKHYIMILLICIIVVLIVIYKYYFNVCA